MILRFSIILSILLHLTSSLICYTPGQCLDSNFVGAIPANEINECLLSCKENIKCYWSTFYPEFSSCNLFSECNDLNNSQCTDCLTSKKECDIIQCDLEGFCTVFCFKLFYF